MKINNIIYSNPKQAVLPMLIQDYLDICDPVLTFDRFMGEIELEKYLKNIPQHYTGRLRYDPVSMLKTVLFGFMANGYISLRELEDQCKVNLRFMYLMDHQAPSYRTFGYFINEVLADSIEEIFQDINKKIFETEHVDLQHLYIDGSKFEANANKYSWVWKKATEKSRYRLFDKITTLFKEINEELCDSAWKSQFFSSIMQPMMQFIGNLGYVVVCILGGYLAVKSVVDIGDIQAFIQYMRNFTSPILKFNAYVGKYVESGEILGRVDGGPYIKSPSNGKFIEVDAERGDYVLTTDVMGYVANTYDMYIGANIEETDITKIKEGQSVKVTLDAYGSQKFEGIVTQVNSITNNALTGQTTSFSTSGTYTKTTQLIPIKIKLVNSDIPLENIIGTNATVNIKVK